MNRKIAVLVMFIAVTLAAIGLAYRANSAQAAEWAAKVDPWVLETAAAQSQTEFLVYLTTQADVSGADALLSKEGKGQYVYDQLTAVAQQTQPAVIAELDALGVAYRPFWVANMIWVKGDLNIVQTMALRADVDHIYANPSVPLQVPAITDEQALIEQAMSVEWNIIQVNAPDVWAAGYTGQGAVIGGQDTGYDWDHPALKNQYRGWNGATTDHNYHWHDAIHVDNGLCLGNSPEPCDDHNHGTHTMGTMVGDDAGSNQIGMAPGAKWIGCRDMNAGNGTPASYSECYQWFIAPTDLNDQNPDPNMAPHVINNSWSCPASEGCTDPNVMLTVVNNVVAAGIVTAHAASNDGPGCSTIADPATIYEASYSVGATDSNDNIASFSSRGPVTSDGSNRMKPNISAPGVSVRSSIRNGQYSIFSGTSMAAPHVAGLVGLLISADPGLAGDVTAIENLINQTALPRTSAQGCGGNGPNDVPNNVYGWGRIDALAAYNSLPTGGVALALSKSVSAATAVPGQLITYTLTVTNTDLVSTTTNLILTDTIPAGTTFVTATLPVNFDGSMVTWQAASLAANTTWMVELVVAVDMDTTGTVANDDYAVRSDDAATVAGDPVETSIVPYELQLSKSGPALVAVGDLITYTLTVTNPHPFADQHDLVLTDTIPNDTSFITATLPHTFDGTAVQWQAGTLAAGASWQVELVVQVNMTNTGTITNADYHVSSAELPAGVAGEPVTTEVQAYAITLVKETAVASALPGDLVTYTLTVANPHPNSTLTGIILTDSIPLNTTFITATTPFSNSTDILRWQQATLAPGTSWTVTLVVQIPISITSHFIENSDYGVRSDQLAVITGPPVVTTIQQSGAHMLYLPFVVRPNLPPNPPTNPSPADGATEQSVSTSLSWTVTDPEDDNLSYDVYLEANNNPPTQLVASSLLVPTYTPSVDFDKDTTYYWRVVVDDGQGGSVEGPVWSFATESTLAIAAIHKQ